MATKATKNRYRGQVFRWWRWVVYKKFLTGHIIRPEGYPPERSIQQCQAWFHTLFADERPSTEIDSFSSPALGIVWGAVKDWWAIPHSVVVCPSRSPAAAIGGFSNVLPVFSQTSRLARIAGFAVPYSSPGASPRNFRILL